MGYRMYTIGRDGHFDGVAEFEAATDAVALEIAQRKADGQAHEVWDRGRLVSRQEPTDTQHVEA